MGGKSKSAPAPPDPNVVSAAQTATNNATAQYNANLNRYDQTTPYGSQTWTQNGKNPDGSPKWASNISLTPDAQSAVTNSMHNASALSGVEGQYINQIGSQLAKPLDTSGITKYQTSVNGGDLDGARQQAQDAIYQRQTAMLDPQYKTQQTQLASQLAQQGITQGSDAYNTAMESFGRQRDFAYGQARDSAVTGGNDYANQQFQQGATNANLNNAAAGSQLQQLLALRNQPFNELSALQSGSQVQTPQFQSSGTVSTPASNISGDIYNSYQGQLDNASSSNAGSNAMMGGLFSLGGSALSSGMFNGLFSASDRRVKKDVTRIGDRSGLPLYAFRYLWEDDSSAVHVGHMADEVAEKAPHAVIRGPEGFDIVNYGALQ